MNINNNKSKNLLELTSNTTDKDSVNLFGTYNLIPGTGKSNFALSTLMKIKLENEGIDFRSWYKWVETYQQVVISYVKSMVTY